MRVLEVGEGRWRRRVVLKTRRPNLDNFDQMAFWAVQTWLMDYSTRSMSCSDWFLQGTQLMDSLHQRVFQLAMAPETTSQICGKYSRLHYRASLSIAPLCRSVLY
jgi:hypothetical protein